MKNESKQFNFTFPLFISLKALQKKSTSTTSGISPVNNQKSTGPSIPKLVNIDGHKTTINVTRSQLMPLPSNFKLVKRTPVVPNIKLSG